MQKENMAHRNRAGGTEFVSFIIERMFKFSLKCADHIATKMGFNLLTPIGPTHYQLK